MNFTWEIATAFISGVIFYFLIKYATYKFKNPILYTEDISTDQITYIEDYKQILQDTGEEFDVIFGRTSYWIMKPEWTILNVQHLLHSLNNKDYLVRVEIINNNFQWVYVKTHTS